MSGRSVSPASRSHIMGEEENFREHKEVDDDCDIEKEEYDDSESEQMSPEVSKHSILSPSKFQSPETSFTHEASPHGSPRLTQRKHLYRGSPPEIKNEKRVIQETSTLTYNINDSGRYVKKVSESDSRRSSLAIVGFQDAKTPTDHKVLNYEEHIEYSSVKSGFIRETEESKFSIFKIIFGSVLVILMAFAIYHVAGVFSRNQVHSDSFKKDSTEAMFAVKWMNLQKSFKNQSRRFWTIIGSATRSVVSEIEPRDPAVILLVVPKNAIQSSRCFVRKYSAKVSGLFKQHENDVIHFNSLVYGDIKPDRVKMKIDQELEKGFRAGKKVAVIDHLESLAAEAAMIFYRFCDNDQAPFKRVTILLVLHLTEDELSEENDRFVEEKLAALWEPIMGEDKFRPLMSRIANSIAFLRPESPEVLAEIGC